MPNAKRLGSVGLKVSQVGRQIGQMPLPVKELLEGVQRVQGEKHTRQAIGGGKAGALQSGKSCRGNASPHGQFRLCEFRPLAQRANQPAESCGEIPWFNQTYGNIAIH